MASARWGGYVSGSSSGGRKPLWGTSQRKRPSREPVRDGEAEARLIVLTCLAPPTAAWTGRSGSSSAGWPSRGSSRPSPAEWRAVHGNNEHRHHLRRKRVIPSAHSGEFDSGWKMACWTYADGRTASGNRRSASTRCPSKWWASPAPWPRRRRAGPPDDYDYHQCGVANVFMAFAPLLGWRRAKVTYRRAVRDFAEPLRELVEEFHEDAERVVVVFE